MSARAGPSRPVSAISGPSRIVLQTLLSCLCCNPFSLNFIGFFYVFGHQGGGIARAKTAFWCLYVDNFQLGANLGQLGANLGPTWPNLAQLGANLGQLGANLGPTWANLGPTWGNLEPTWGQLETTWCLLGGLLIGGSAVAAVAAGIGYMH